MNYSWIQPKRHPSVSKKLRDELNAKQEELESVTTWSLRKTPCLTPERRNQSSRKSAVP